MALTSNSTRKTKNPSARLFITMTPEDMQFFMKAKSMVRNQLIQSDQIRENDNISQTLVIKSILNYYCKEKKIA